MIFSYRTRKRKRNLFLCFLFFITILTFKRHFLIFFDTGGALNQSYQSRCENLDWPDIWDNFPQFEGNKKLISAKMLTPKGHDWNRLVFGIPSVVRENKTYLTSTLDSLFSKMDSDLRPHTLFIVYLAGETASDTAYVDNMSIHISERYQKMIGLGVLEIIAPPAAWYPKDDPPIEIDKLKQHWKTKQNLDFMMLMNYAQSRGDFYIQLEDDLEVAHNYLRNIWNYLNFREGSRWYSIEFSYLGMIGKALRCYDLQSLISFAAREYSNIPIDFIWEDMVKANCDHTQPDESCKPRDYPAKNTFHPPQFQHMGVFSSQNGKMQYLKEPYWNQGNPKLRRNNPKAIVTTNMELLEEITVQRSYLRHIWVPLRPIKGDHIRFSFVKPFNLKKIFISTGSHLYPRDLLRGETTVSLIKKATEKNIGRFDEFGSFTATLDGTEVNDVIIRVTEPLNNTILIQSMFFL